MTPPPHSFIFSFPTFFWFFFLPSTPSCSLSLSSPVCRFVLNLWFSEHHFLDFSSPQGDILIPASLFFHLISSLLSESSRRDVWGDGVACGGEADGGVCVCVCVKRGGGSDGEGGWSCKYCFKKVQNRLKDQCWTISNQILTRTRRRGHVSIWTNNSLRLWHQV